MNVNLASLPLGKPLIIPWSDDQPRQEQIRRVYLAAYHAQLNGTYVSHIETDYGIQITRTDQPTQRRKYTKLDIKHIQPGETILVPWERDKYGNAINAKSIEAAICSLRKRGATIIADYLPKGVTVTRK